MTTMIYRIDNQQNVPLTPEEQKILTPITSEGIDIPSWVKALGRQLKTQQDRVFVMRWIDVFKKKGVIKTKLIGSSIARSDEAA
ncbi:MAG: hypothetical protein AAF921_14015 [Cyanobacteria bacterium P01_D01_bin.44]